MGKYFHYLVNVIENLKEAVCFGIPPSFLILYVQSSWQTLLNFFTFL